LTMLPSPALHCVRGGGVGGGGMGRGDVVDVGGGGVGGGGEDEMWEEMWEEEV